MGTSALASPASHGHHRGMGSTHDYARWLYKGGRPNRFAKLANRISASASSAGLLRSRDVALEVRGRRSGKTISFPVVIADYDGGRYLVSMLGSEANWVRNLEADGGRAELCHRGRTAVHLAVVDPTERAPIFREYLRVAPGARPHIPVDRRAPLEAFARVADDYPVYRIEPSSDGT